MARDSQGIPEKKMRLSSMHSSMTAHRPSTPSASSKMGGKDDMPPKEMGEGGEHSMKIFDHGDGSYHSEAADGTRTEHSHVGHLAAHVANHHEPGNHLHVMHHGGGMTTAHHTKEGSPEVHGPHDHSNLEELKSNMDKFLGEEEHEGHSEGQGDDAEPAMSGSPMY